MPGGDRLVTDTLVLPVQTYTFLDQDSILLDKSEQYLLGWVNDPMFGTTSASIFCIAAINAGLSLYKSGS